MCEVVQDGLAAIWTAPVREAGYSLRNANSMRRLADRPVSEFIGLDRPLTAETAGAHSRRADPFALQIGADCLGSFERKLLIGTLIADVVGVSVKRPRRLGTKMVNESLQAASASDRQT